MATSTVYITGVGKWAHLYESQMDTKFGEKFHVILYPDSASLIALKEAGSRVKPHEDEDGIYFKFSRDNKKVFKDTEEILGPPDVIEVVDGERVAFDKIIGNGSTLTLRLSIYDSKFGKGTRLEAVRVDKHVPYVSQTKDGEPATPLYAF